MKNTIATKKKPGTKTSSPKPLRVRAGIKAGRKVLDRPGGGC